MDQKPVLTSSARCKSCGAAIEWAVSVNKRPMPVNVGAHPGGNLVVVEGVARRRTDADIKAGLEPRISHHATCPQAATWRKS